MNLRRVNKIKKTIKIQRRFGEQEVPAPTINPDINKFWFFMEDMGFYMETNKK